MQIWNDSFENANTKIYKPFNAFYFKIFEAEETENLLNWVTTWDLFQLIQIWYFDEINKPNVDS